MDLTRMQSLATSDSSLYWYVQGVRTGMQVKQMEAAKWTRIAVIASLTFGVMTFFRHMGE